MGRRRIVRLLAALALGLAVWHLGHGLYIQVKAQLAQHLLRVAWEETLEGAERVKPWPWADTWPVARLRAPRQHTDLIVLAGDTGRTLAFGPGHRLGTPPPGALGNSLIGGHRDTHFRFLKDVAAGDEFELQTAGGEVARYRVVAMQVVPETAGILQHPEGSMLTLVTCYPFDAVAPGGPLRYVVFAVRVEGSASEDTIWM